MKKVVYTEGPDRVVCGVAGEFRKGVPKEVEDDIAERLLKKTSIKFKLSKPVKKGKDEV